MHSVCVCVLQGVSARRRRLDRMSVDVLRSRSRDRAGERDAALRLQVLLVLLRPLSHLPADRPDAPLPLAATESLITAFGVLHGLAPPDMNQLVRVSELPGRRRLRSSSSLQLLVPPFRLTSYNRQSTFLSSRLVTPMEFAAI